MIMVQAVWSSSAEILLFFSSTSIGGLALSETKMAIFLSTRPLLVCIFTIFVCPWLFRKYDCYQILRWFIFFPIMYAAAFWMSAIAAGKGKATPAVTVLLLGLVLILQMLASPHYLASNVLVNARAPTAGHLSRLNACAELVNQIGIGLGAEIGSTVYAWSNVHHVQQGKLPWIFLVAFSGTTAWICQYLTQRDGWREKKTEEKLSS